MMEVAVVCSVRERIELLINDELTWDKSFKGQVLHLTSKLAQIENLLKRGKIFNFDLEIQAIQQLAHEIENTVEFLALQQGPLSSKLKTLWRFKGFFEFPLARIYHQAIELQKLKERIGTEPYGDDDFVSLEYPLLGDCVVGKQLNPATENVWRSLARLCCELPLAIILISAILRFKRLDLSEALYELEDYQNHNLEYCQKKCLQDCKISNFMTSENAESLIYKHLPFQLKPCFLYLGCFRRGQLIPVEKLYLLWMAEGFVSVGDQGHQRRMDIIKDYLLLLDQKSLVKLGYEDFSSDHTLISCELHDEISNLCVSMGHNEGFSERRIIVYLDTYEADDLLSISQPERVRSLIFLGTGSSTSQPKWPSQVSDLEKFRSARAVDFNDVDFKNLNLVKSIGKLVFLRHLGFRECNLHELPLSFSQLPYLETLDLRVKTSCKMMIPNVLWKMTSLRHLYLPKSFISITGEKLKLRGLKKLEILENFHADSCDADDLPMLGSLQILIGFVDGNNEDIKKLIRFIHGNDRLCHAALAVQNFDCYSEERINILSTLIKCNPLHVLYIEGHLRELKPCETFGFCLTEMIFKESVFDNDPMPILGKLPNLRSLVLWKEAFIGRKMECSARDFPKLTCLKLNNLRYLTEWFVESGAMPCILSLTLERCPKFTMLPDFLMKMTTLREVRITQMPKIFQERLSEVAEEQRSFGMIISLM